LYGSGPVEVRVPRDVAGTFEPQIVRERRRRAGPVVSARGLTHGEIAAHLAEVYGIEVSKQAISVITVKVVDGMAEWQNRVRGVRRDLGRQVPRDPETVVRRSPATH
jgi:putative transposase